MGWSLSIKEIKKEQKYKIWSSISDSYITKKWLNRKELIQFLFWYKFNDFMENFVKDAMTFPNKWSMKNLTKFERINNDLGEDWYDLQSKSLKDHKIMGDKFIDELSKYDIKLDISDKNFCINNTKSN